MNNPKAEKKPRVTEPIAKMRSSIYSVLSFTPTEVSIPKGSASSRTKIRLTRDQLSEWIACCKQTPNVHNSTSSEQLGQIQLHFEALEAILSALLEENKLRKKDSVLYGLYAFAIVNFCRCLESYSPIKINASNRHKHNLSQLAGWLRCDRQVVRLRNMVSHDSGHKPPIEQLNQVVAIALQWLDQNFFPNLRLIEPILDGKATLEYKMDFPKVKLDFTILEVVIVPEAATACKTNQPVKRKGQDISPRVGPKKIKK